MSIRVEFRDGVFAPLRDVEEPTPRKVYQLFSESELKQLVADAPWLRGSERSLDFWESEQDAVYDSL